MWNRWLENEPRETLVCAVMSGVALALSATGTLRGILPFDTAWAAIILCGVPILVEAFRSVVFERDIKADFLVALALIASVATGEFFAAGEVALIMQIGELLEDYASGKAKAGIEKFIKLTPQTARVRREDGERIVPVEEVAVGDTLVVLAGETIPVDGVILEGETAIDQSVMTGESIPVDKSPGDRVSSGTVNRFGAFTMRAERVSGDSALQRMVRLVEEAEKNKAPIVTAADRWATWLVVAALFCALITWVVTGIFLRAVTMLIVFCPCSFVLATPTAVAAGIGNAAKYGMMIRSGEALEKLSRVQRVAFDKTGTLTYGRPQVTAGVSVDPAYRDADVLRYAALAEQRSEHPLGRAILNAYPGPRTEATNCRILAGQGLSATVEGHTVLVGKADLLADRGISTERAATQAQVWLDKGATVVYLAVDGATAGFVALADTLREDAGATVRKLNAAGVTPMLLTGDNEAAAQAVSAVLGIVDVRANLLPEEKLRAIQECAGGSEPVCMVGDGVNDAPALAAADAGVAMGGIGSDIAVESADAVLVSDEIKRLPYLFALTRKVMGKVRGNIIASLVINLSAVVLSATGVLTPLTGALWHNCGALFVVGNAALLLRLSDEA